MERCYLGVARAAFNFAFPVWVECPIVDQHLPVERMDRRIKAIGFADSFSHRILRAKMCGGS